MTDWTSLDYAVVDVEGNGQQPPDLVELAVVPVRSGVIGEPSSWLVKPAEPIKHFATQIHGLTGTDVADAPKFADIAEQVRSALDVPALVAHNAHVDVSVLNRNWKAGSNPRCSTPYAWLVACCPDGRATGSVRSSTLFTWPTGCRTGCHRIGRPTTRW